MAALLRARLAAPRCPSSSRPSTPLVFRAWSPGDRLVPGVWDIPVPLAAAPEVLPDVLLVPSSAFDRKGFRLGYGGGFYDRTLAKLRAAEAGHRHRCCLSCPDRG